MYFLNTDYILFLFKILVLCMEEYLKNCLLNEKKNTLLIIWQFRKYCFKETNQFSKIYVLNAFKGVEGMNQSYWCYLGLEPWMWVNF